MLNQVNAFDLCQQESIRFLASRYRAGCGDKPGLGKTLTAILAAEMAGARHALAICPPSVRSNWEDQTRNYATGCQWDIIGDSELGDPMKLLRLRDRYDVVVPDEAHRYKEFESQRTMAVFGPGGLASRSTYYIWSLSGTFSPNGRPVEYWPLLKSCHPKFASMSFAAFTRRYCGAFFDGRAMNVKGASNVEEFKALLDEFIISHTKAQAFPGRKEPLVVRVPVELTNSEMAAVVAAEKEIISREAFISSTKEKNSALGDSATLRRLVGLALAPHAAAFAREKLTGVRKVVVFFQHTAVGKILHDKLQEFHPLVYQGGMTDFQKEWVKGYFGFPVHRVMLVQQQAGGTGINGLQQHSSTAIFAEPDWVPGETEQRIDRLDRMGSESDLVTAYQMYARGTMHSAVLGVHDRKENVRARLE